MSSSPSDPAGPVPEFRRLVKRSPWETGPCETVPVDEKLWRRLYSPGARASPWRPRGEGPIDGVPTPPPPDHLVAAEGPAQKLRQKPVGLKRLGRQFETWRFSASESEVSGLLPDAGIYGSPGPDDWTAITPFRWSVDQLPRAYMRALKITRSVGLNFAAKMQWIFRDAMGTWWMLPDYCGEFLGPDGDDVPNAGRSALSTPSAPAMSRIHSLTIWGAWTVRLNGHWKCWSTFPMRAG